jgi:hypothetical protein
MTVTTKYFIVIINYQEIYLKNSIWMIIINYNKIEIKHIIVFKKVKIIVNIIYLIKIQIIHNI